MGRCARHFPVKNLVMMKGFKLHPSATQSGHRGHPGGWPPPGGGPVHYCSEAKVGHPTMLLWGLQAMATLEKGPLLTRTNCTRSHSSHSTPIKSSPLALFSTSASAPATRSSVLDCQRGSRLGPQPPQPPPSQVVFANRIHTPATSK